MWDMHDGMGWWMVFGSIWMVFFWAVLIGTLAWLVSRVVGYPRARHGDALEVAKQRYASGEISREDFQRISEDLAKAGSARRSGTQSNAIHANHRG